MQFISLLDLQRTVQKVFIRAGIPMWYTKGFNPHPKIIFAAPLSVGTESVCEYIDVRIEREMSCEEILRRINGQLTSEFCALEVYEPQTKLNEIAWSEYDIEIFCDASISDEDARISKVFATDELKMIKRTKSGEKEFNIIPFIKSFNVSRCDESNSVKINTVLSVAAESYLNPELLISAIKERCNIFHEEDELNRYTIMRKKIFFADGVSEFR
jgi:radical SAM-linked protein